MKAAFIISILLAALALAGCQDDRHSRWHCFCCVDMPQEYTDPDYPNSTCDVAYDFLPWCEDSFNEWEAGAAAQVECLTAIPNSYDTGSIGCDCICSEEKVPEEACY